MTIDGIALTRLGALALDAMVVGAMEVLAVVDKLKSNPLPPKAKKHARHLFTFQVQ
jgi:hypothetical protein